MALLDVSDKGIKYSYATFEVVYGFIESAKMLNVIEIEEEDYVIVDKEMFIKTINKEI